MRFLIVPLLLLAAATSAAEPPDVIATETGIGTIFTTADGRSLYTSDNDINRDESVCVGACAETWPPLRAAASAAPVGEWTVAVRDDGARQWSFRGKPVYTFARDTAAGMTLGDGVQDIWHIAVALAPRPRAVVFQGTAAGRVAASTNGLTLYAADGECTDKCLNVWTPLKATVAANTVGDWSAVLRRDDGTKQWAYRGRPVYTFANDFAPGDMRGEGMDGAWHAVMLQPAPALPAGVAVRASSPGPIFVDGRGMTLYGGGADFEEIKRRFCDVDCLKANWSPVPAGPNAMPSGNWLPIETPGGKQWTYRGEPVFTFVGDKNPGDVTGDRFAAGIGLNGFHVLQQKSLVEESF